MEDIHRKKIVLTADITASLNTANFKCNECKKAFISDITLKNHLKKRHNSFSDIQVYKKFEKCDNKNLQESRRIKYLNVLDSINESKSDDNIYSRNYPKIKYDRNKFNCDCSDKSEVVKVDFSTQTVNDEELRKNSGTQTYEIKSDVSVQYFYRGVELGVNTRQIKTANTYTQYIQEIKNIGITTEPHNEQKGVQTETNQSEKSCMINSEKQDSVPFMERMKRFKRLKNICENKGLTDFSVKYYYDLKLKDIGISPEQVSLTIDEINLCNDLLERQTAKLKQQYPNFSKIKDKINHELNEVLKEFS